MMPASQAATSEPPSAGATATTMPGDDLDDTDGEHRLVGACRGRGR